MNNRLFISNDASLNGKLAVAGDVSFNGRLLLSSDASLNGKLAVAGDVSLNGNLLISRDVTIGGNLKVNQYSNNSIISTTVTNYALIVAEDLSINGKVYITGDVSINNKLYIGNDASFNGNLYVNNKLSFGKSPITTFYTYSSPTPSTASNPGVSIQFSNQSFYAKITAFVTCTTNVNDIASISLDVRGGTTDGSVPTKPIGVINGLQSSSGTNDFKWNPDLIQTNYSGNNCNLYLPILNQVGGNAVNVSIRIELLQTSINTNGNPTVQSIIFS